MIVFDSRGTYTMCVNESRSQMDTRHIKHTGNCMGGLEFKLQLTD